MDKIGQFKDFVKNNPKLISYVKKGEMTWQKFYEIYDLYGEENDIWDEYIKSSTVANASTQTSSLTDIFSWLKNIDLNKMQEGINSVQRVVGVLQDFGDKEEVHKTEYKPRPLYKHFED